MADGRGDPVQRPQTSRGRWTSFVAAVAPAGRRSRTLCEEGNPSHRVRVEHDNHTLLVHISDEHGGGWTTLALDRATRAWSIAQRDSQLSAAGAAHTALYDIPSKDAPDPPD
jgi:hypothetical protein